MNYAQISDGIVVNVIVADAEFIATSNLDYVLLSRGGIGWTYDGTNFIAPRPFESWSLDNNFDWQPPTPMPSTGGRYRWSEEDLAWVAIYPGG